MAGGVTKSELVAYLDAATRELSPDAVGTFTTARIAQGCHVSRSLASQYLNELVRAGVVVKVNERPVLFFHKPGLARFLQAHLSRCEYNSMRELLAEAKVDEAHDFDKAIGFDMSYGTCVDQLKSAVRYPPNGLPVLLVGEHGTGKQLMSELTFEFGLSCAALPKTARYVMVDCAKYDQDESSLETDLFGSDGQGGAVGRAHGGVVYIKRFDHLSYTSREYLLQHIREQEESRSDDPAPRFLLATSRPLDSAVVKSASRCVPIVISLPRLADRGVEERTQLVMHYLRVEGRRVAADVSVSRGALRALVNAEFEDNVDGLRSCITNCCASAYASSEQGHLVIRTYNLPPEVLGSAEPHPDDDQLVSGSKRDNDPSARVVSLFQRLVSPAQAWREGSISFSELYASATEVMHDYGDYLDFEEQGANSRVDSYERLLNPVVEEANRIYATELSRKVSHVMAQSIYTQLRESARLSRWRTDNASSIRLLLTALSQNLSDVRPVVEQIASQTKSALGIGLDELSCALLYLEVEQIVSSTSGPRDYLGVIICHGYSTATSIADAADRILHQHVFEAIDMTYEQELDDAVGQLSRLLERYSHCKAVAILVDMGSLERVSEVVGDLANCDVYIVNNVSTALALEVGSALMAHADLGKTLESVAGTCSPRLSLVRGAGRDNAVLFCSESGMEAADRIRRLIGDSTSGELGVRLITADFNDLLRNGDRAQAFSSCKAKAIVGTMDPGIASVPFVALEDILYQGSSEVIDKAFLPSLGPEGIARFHASLLRNLTLRNVLGAITILNPEMLYFEADRAVQRLTELAGEQIDARRRIGVYVHLCGLIERLVTKSFVDTYPGIDNFVEEHADFVDAFRASFADMSKRYRVEIPLSEIAYVHHMLHVRLADLGKRTDIAGLILEDE